jgi:hypothetical protein
LIQLLTGGKFEINSFFNFYFRIFNILPIGFIEVLKMNKKEEMQYSKAVYRRIQGETTHEEFIKEYWGMV